MKNFQEERAKFVFLHKDYLGSILAITDEAGKTVEQRHYDAWGSFTHLKVGYENITTDQSLITNTQLLIDRGYTSHEHFAEVGIIHMNGRLYDPLLRRFLNADENIQDPHNTQNYNKYGYVMNNPLMYNDPSGEFFVAGFFLTWIAPIIWGAIVGAAVGAGLYVLQGLFTNNWSWSGFGKSVLIGAITGGVAGGLGQVFSTSSFWGSVANGALSGAGTGGVTSLINGTNFLEGVIKGAVIGGAVAAVAGISYTINFLCNTKVDKLTESDLNFASEQSSTVNPSTDPDVLNERIRVFRETNYSPEQIKRYGINGEKLDIYSINNSGGYIDGGVIAETRPNFFSNTSNIRYSARAANNPYLLGKTMAHETAHSYANKLTRYIPFSGNRIKSGLQDGRLDTIEHLAIKKLENVYYNINLNGIDIRGLNIIPSQKINSIINGLSPTMQSHIQSWTDILHDVFNRKVTYQGVSW